MKFLGFYIGYHDSSIAVSIDGKVKYAKSERITGIKHHKANLTFIKEVCDKWKIKTIDAVAFSDGNRNGLGCCNIDEFAKQVNPCLDFFGNIPTFCIDHHYAHILSAWPVVSMEKVDVGIAIDGNGDNRVRTRVISSPASARPQTLYYNQNRSFGTLLERIGMLMNLEGYMTDLSGKVMGAQAYGSIDYEYVSSIDIEEIVGNRIYDFIREIPWRGVIPEPNPLIYKNPLPHWKSVSNPDFFNFDNPSFRDWLSTIHYIIECYITQLFNKFCNKDQVIVYSGGCSQNVVCNEKLCKLFPNLFIPPHGYDGGISLGCLEFLRLQYKEQPFSTQGFPYWQNDCESEQPSHQTIKQVVELLKQGKIVGWFQGRGEIGPRALGHRSILMDSRNSYAKDIINSKIKHREPWRPYAPSVLESLASDWFDLDRPSPYMLRSVLVKEERRETIPAVVHHDGTSRVQTVPDNESHELTAFTELLLEFYKQTGIPMLLNTSLNSGGSPIFSSIEQSLQFYKLVPMDAICIGNKLFTR
jgi:carbamoyltransferase